MLRAVLDANVLVSALIRPKGPPGQVVVRLLRDRAFTLVTSPAILTEVRRSLAYPRVRKHLIASDEDLDLWVASLALVGEPVEGILRIGAVAEDPEDDKYIAAALEGRAQFIVTGDAHLLTLKIYEGVRMVTPRVFLGLLKD
ncbi:MAG: putative toxin-antitoxin system toxin component, PIN family [candidate division NC10 bacterium]|nr:putative toxin-antitoxin system toxin component, PIN family [candidate division NC10 bacterium]